jgi:hypothetical protein
MRTWIKTGSALGAMALMLALASVAFAAPVEIRLSVQPTVVPVDDVLHAQVEVTGQRNGRVSLKTGDGLEIVGTSSQSHVNFINGQLSVSRATVFTLRARRQGTFNVVAEMAAAGKTLRSNAVTVTVGRAAPAAPPPAPNAPPAANRPDGAEGKMFFVQPVVKPTDPVLGRQVTVEYYLYVRDDVQLEDADLAHMPEFVGFTQHELPTASSLVFQPQTVNGAGYRVALLKRFALFPTSVGEQTIGSMGVRLQYAAADTRRRHDGPFGGMFPLLLREREVIDLESPPVKIKVLPLPTAGQPPDFAGAVGRFAAKAEVDRADAPAGEPFTLKVTVSGEGNLDTIRRPKLALDNNLRVYSEKDRTEPTAGFDKFSGQKIFETILIAGAPGEYQIPAVRLPYFDPEAGEYREAVTSPLAVTITGEASATAPKQLTAISREAVELRGRDLRYIRRDRTALQSRREPLGAKPWVWFALGAWPLIVAGVVVWQVRQGRLRADRRSYRSRRALKEARQRLRASRDLLRSPEAAPFYTELHRAVLGFIADKLDAAAPGLERAELLSSLHDKGVREESLTLLDELWREADAVRFGGMAAEAAVRRASLQRADDLLAALGEELTK